MKSLTLACAAALLLAAAPLPHAARGAGRAQKFSSAYTDLKTQCRYVEGAAAEGQDAPMRCAGHGGYEIMITFSAASSHLSARPPGKGDAEHVHLAAQALDYDSKRKIEWRMADGKPFAVILRVDKVREDVDPAEMWRPENKTGESLLVKGLKGYERIDFEVDAKTPDANLRARQLADEAYANAR